VQLGADSHESSRQPGEQEGLAQAPAQPNILACRSSAHLHDEFIQANLTKHNGNFGTKRLSVVHAMVHCAIS
jgi:hypothetical protein